MSRLLDRRIGAHHAECGQAGGSKSSPRTPESGHRTGHDGHKRRKGSKTLVAVDTLGPLLAPQVTPANEQERAQVDVLAAEVHMVTGEHKDKDQSESGDDPRPRGVPAWRGTGVS